MKLGVIETKLEEAGIELDEFVLTEDLDVLRELELIDINGESSEAHYTLSIPLMGQWIASQRDYEDYRGRARAEAEDLRANVIYSKELQIGVEDLKRLTQGDDEDD